MLKKKLTFMLVPNASDDMRQISIPYLAIYASVLGVLALVFVSFFFSASFFGDRVSQHELQQLRAENDAILGKYEQLRWQLTEVEDRYDRLVTQEKRIRTLFDLPAIDDQQRQLGIGGPTPPALATMSPTLKAAYATEAEVDRLLNLSQFELEQYSEVEDKLVKLKDRLAHTPSIWPSKGWQSRGYGMKGDPFTGYKRMHNGIDIANRTGTPIVASADGVIKKVGTAGGLGKIVVIDHGYGFRTRYAHLSKAKVKRGTRVKRGEIIGLMGSTGYSTGPHLHYEVIRNGKSLNPSKYILNRM